MTSALAAFGGGALRLKYFLELTTHEGEFVVHHEKLIEYGIVTSNRSSTIKEKLNALELVENEDYSELQDVLQLRPQGGTSIKKVYMLTPEAFKKCLMRAQRRPKQKVDPVIYCDYYLLLEKTYKLYTDYEKQLLNKQLEQKDHQLKQKDVQLKNFTYISPTKPRFFESSYYFDICLLRTLHIKMYNIC